MIDVGSWRCGISGMSERTSATCGDGLPLVSVSRPMMLWKYAVERSPPFHQVE